MQRAFPAASVEVGRVAGPVWRRAFGTLTYDPYAPETTDGTIFDLASLTKVIATTTLAMRAVDAGALNLDDSVRAWLPAWRGSDREMVTIRDLLAHTSGLPAYLPFFRDHTGRAEFEAAICNLPLEYPPRSLATYSDLGFILLGFILEDARGNRSRASGMLDPTATLAAQFRKIASYMTAEPLAFNPPRPWRDADRADRNRRVARPAPHRRGPRREHLGARRRGRPCRSLRDGAGRRHVRRAALKTIAGEPVLAQPATIREFIRRTAIPGSSRALGWDTMLPTSSCGTRLSPTAIGHTGFTGTSLWIDWERDLYIVLLTNRVHPTRENELLRTIRPRFHDAVFESLITNP